jgi:hypothetical protein
MMESKSIFFIEKDEKIKEMKKLLNYKHKMDNI